MKRLILTGASLLLLLGCSADPAHHVDDEPECRVDSDCLDGQCRQGYCEGWPVAEECSADGDCAGDERCLGQAGERACVADGTNQEDNQEDNQEENQEEELDAFQGITSHTFCAAGGVASADGIQMIHCLGAYDSHAPVLRSPGLRMESGGFSINAADQ